MLYLIKSTSETFDSIEFKTGIEFYYNRFHKSLNIAQVICRKLLETYNLKTKYLKC